MKLQELAATHRTKQYAKVFESYFGKRIQIDALSSDQAQGMLQRVRDLVGEHRRTSEFHKSEQNPAYLKLVMMEQILSARVMEVMPAVAPAGAPGSATVAAPGTVNPADALKQKALQTAQIAQNKRSIQDQIKMKQSEIVELQKQMNNPTMAENRRSMRRRLKESEVQQAQVVLASQDMVDQVQKMLEQVSAMQFKDLPALVDQVKNQVGVDQAMQFNTDASAALTGMIQNLQGSKQQLEAALGVVTGQAPVVPGDTGMAPGADMAAADADMAAAGTDMGAADADLDAELDANLEPGSNALGRGRR
jgi:hypothetical protein